MLHEYYNYHKPLCNPVIERREAMLQEIKKGLLTGFGAVLLTKEKIEAITKKITDEANLEKEEAEKLKDELYEAGEQQWSEMDSFFTDLMERTLKKLNLAKESKMEELAVKVDNLEKRIMLLEDMMGGGEKEG